MQNIRINGNEFYNLPSVRISDATTPTITHQFDDTTIATVSAPDPGEILAGKYAWANGTTVTGSMYNHSNNNIRLTSTATVSISEGYYNGNGNVGIDSLELNKIIPENIKSGVTILGVSGNYSGGSTPSYTVTDVSESDVISGKHFYKATSTSNVTRSTGTMPTFSGAYTGAGPTISSSPDYIGVRVNTPGYYTSDAKLVCSYGDMANAIGLTSTIIKNGETVLGVTGSYSPSLTSKSITANGTYTASSEGYDGYYSVVVNVSGGGGFNIDLTGTTWVLNSVISLNPYSLFSIYFEDDYSHNNWLALDIDSDGKSSGLQYKDGKSDTTVYINNSWVNNGYKTITITGGTDVSNPYLVAWLLQNATKQ